MGHLINPISTRLGFTAFWISNWSCFNVSNFSYNLMVDNLIRNFIIWAFSENRASSDLTIVGVFLSHFKIVRRGNNIRVFLFMVLDSSRLLKSQSVEADSNVFGLYNLYNERKMLTLGDLDFRYLNNETGSLKKAKLNALSSISEKYYLFLRQSISKQRVSNYISLFVSSLLSTFFDTNKHFLGFKINIDPVFIKTASFLNPSFLSRFLSRRLSYGFELNRVLKPIVSNLKRLVDSRSSGVSGFRISCRGRFNKTQMASYTWEKYGPIPLNNFNCLVNYSFSKVIMKYGACGIKVWIFTSAPAYRSCRSAALRQHLFTDTNKFLLRQQSQSDFFFLEKFRQSIFLKNFFCLLKLFSEDPVIPDYLLKNLLVIK